VQVISNALWRTVLNKATVNVRLDGLFRVLVKLQNELFKNVVLYFSVRDYPELIFQVAIAFGVLIVIADILFVPALSVGGQVVPVLFEIVDDFFLFLYSLSFCHVAEKRGLLIDFLVLVHQLRLELVALL
jgi:hypothetical protein